MTPEQRNTCRAIAREGEKINREINTLRSEEARLRAERQSTQQTIATHKRDIARLQRSLATACLPEPQRRRRRGDSALSDGVGVFACIVKVQRIRREIDGLNAAVRAFESRSREIDRELEIKSRQIAGKEALFPVLRRQKAMAGCP